MKEGRFQGFSKILINNISMLRLDVPCHSLILTLNRRKNP
ncbi:hypothetical protein S101450_00783 [Komagataeibacter saccharivorans]|nr:hypothetical protein S101450_00783 [Komagataeibacter saccharivorans]